MKKSSILIVGVVAVLAAASFFYNRDQPSASGDGRSGPPIVAVKVPELAPVEKTGEQAFNTYCATCHGKNAAGQDGVAPPFVHPIYRPGHHSDVSFFMATQNGARAHHWRFGDMPPVEGVTESEVADIVSYVRALQRANGID